MGKDTAKIQVFYECAKCGQHVYGTMIEVPTSRYIVDDCISCTKCDSVVGINNEPIISKTKLLIDGSSKKCECSN